MADNKIEFEAEFERDTKNMRRFHESSEEGDIAAMGTAYISKFRLKNDLGVIPERVRITIEAL